MKETLTIAVLSLVLLSDIARAQEDASRNAGSRLSDTELLACLDPNFPGLSGVIALRDSGQISSAISELTAFVRARQEPADFGQRAGRKARADMAAAEEVDWRTAAYIVALRRLEFTYKERGIFP